MADKTRKVLRLNRVTGDGKPTEGLVTLILKDPVSGEELREDDGTPAVTMQLRPMPEDERRAIVQTHTVLEKDPNGGRGLFERVDSQAANDEILRKAIVSWSGIAGADDKPLVCTDVTKQYLDSFVRSQVTKKLFGSEVVDVRAASFR